MPCELAKLHIGDLSEAGILLLLVVGRLPRLLDRGGKLLGLGRLKLALAALLGGLHGGGSLGLGGGGGGGLARAGTSAGLSTSKTRDLLQTGHAVPDGADGAV